MKIKIKYHNQNCKIEQHGNWCDLKSSETITLKGITKHISYNCDSSSIKVGKSENKFCINQTTPSIPKETFEFDSKLISLGVSIQLPKYFEANVVPRSSLFLKKGIIMGNSVGIIDYLYSGNEDIWRFPTLSTRETKIEEGERICQFSIRPSMDAPIWTKIKWLFTNKIEFVEVEYLDNKNRGGFGHSGGYKQ
jgi:dUTP pyrophosphatase